MFDARGYVHRRRFSIVGVCDTDFGKVPFSWQCNVKGDVPDGAVDFGSDEGHPSLAKAIEGSHGPIGHVIRQERMKLATENLVERSRQGDQNAMAIIQMIRLVAKKGNEKAREAYKLIDLYIKTHPKTSIGNEPVVNFGIEKAFEFSRKPMPPEGYAANFVIFVPCVGNLASLNDSAARVLSGGKKIDEATFHAVRNAISTTPKSQTMFRKSYSVSRNPNALQAVARQAKTSDETKAVQTGFVLGRTRLFQGVSEGSLPISLLDPNAAWEAGDEE